jgi:hypothetical protein
MDARYRISDVEAQGERPKAKTKDVGRMNEYRTLKTEH